MGFARMAILGRMVFFLQLGSQHPELLDILLESPSVAHLGIRLAFPQGKPQDIRQVLLGILHAFLLGKPQDILQVLLGIRQAFLPGNPHILLVLLGILHAFLPGSPHILQVCLPDILPEQLGNLLVQLDILLHLDTLPDNPLAQLVLLAFAGNPLPDMGQDFVPPSLLPD